MIVANVRAGFTREDAQVALSLLSQQGGDAADRGEALLRDGRMEALLDEPALLRAMVTSPHGARASFALFAYVVARHALLQSGENDRMLADYAASILMNFGLGGRAHRVSDADDERYDTLAEILAAADGPDPRRNLFARAHLGNYALWLAGLFPDHIEARRWRRGGPGLEYYDEMGQRGFRLAAEHRLANEHGLVPLFTLVADRFPVMRVALNRVSDTLLFPSGSSPERVMRQVRDDVRWRH
jgi:hypothetical protein